MTDHTPSPATDGLRARLTDALDRMVCPWDKVIVERLLADPAPEAARGSARRFWEETQAWSGNESSDPRINAALAECDFAEEHARHIVNDEVLVEVGLIRHALGATATPADLPVATGVTTEDEGCSAGHLEHGACACPAPAPVVSAGDEWLSQEERREWREDAEHGEECAQWYGEHPSRVIALLDALEASEARVAEAGARALREHRVEWADYIEDWSAAVGPQPPTVETIIAALRMPEPPFGRARGDVS